MLAVFFAVLMASQKSNPGIMPNKSRAACPIPEMLIFGLNPNGSVSEIGFPCT